MVEDYKITIVGYTESGARVYEVSSGDGARKLKTTSPTQLLDWVEWELRYLGRPDAKG